MYQFSEFFMTNPGLVQRHGKMTPEVVAEMVCELACRTQGSTEPAEVGERIDLGSPWMSGTKGQRCQVTGGSIRIGHTLSPSWVSAPASCQRPCIQGRPLDGGFHGAVPASFFLGGGRRAGVGLSSCFPFSWLSLTPLLSDG